jgi:hypothetical protein
MTITQAHQFIGRWRRIFIPWPSPHTDTDAARALERAFLGISVAIIVSPIPALLGLVASRSLHLSGWWFAVIIPAVAVVLFFRWLGLRFRDARQLLEEADTQHLSDLREHLYDKPVA